MIIGIAGKKQSGKDEVAKMIQYLYWRKLVLDKGMLYPEMIAAYESFENKYLNNNNFQIKKFADTLKDIVCLLLGCTREALEDEEYKNTELVSWGSELHPKMTPRLMLQLVGTECGREIIHPNVWVNATMEGYYPYSARGSDYEFEESKWIISDVRFPNEVEAIKEKGGIVIRVDRLSKDRHCQACGLSELDHLEEKNGTIYSKYRHMFRTKEYEHPSETALDKYKEWDYHIHNNGTLEDLYDKVKQILTDENVI